MAIGVVLIAVAMFLAVEVKSLLVGESADAKLEDVVLMRASVSEAMKVKASAGIRTLADITAFIEARARSSPPPTTRPRKAAPRTAASKSKSSVRAPRSNS